MEVDRGTNQPQAALESLIEKRLEQEEETGGGRGKERQSGIDARATQE